MGRKQISFPLGLGWRSSKRATRLIGDRNVFEAGFTATFAFEDFDFKLVLTAGVGRTSSRWLPLDTTVALERAVFGREASCGFSTTLSDPFAGRALRLTFRDLSGRISSSDESSNTS
jgi:hypothetical protein